MKLNHDLYDVYGQKIAAQGCEINRRLVRQLIEKGAHLPRKLISVANTPVLKDFNKALQDRRYRKVFQPLKTQRRIFKTFVRLKLTEPVILELRKMKYSLYDAYHHVLVMAALVIKMIQDIKKSNYDPLLAAHLCLTHDIGKTRISKSVLNKKSELTLEEYQMIKTHPFIGFLLLSYYCGWEGKQYCETAFEHHEKLDGSGYPRGIKRIDRYAQLIAPVDIYDALISRRPYRQISYGSRLAIDILLEDAKKGKLNKQNVYLLINCMRDKKVRSLSETRVSRKRRNAPPPHNIYGKIRRKKARRLLRKD